MIITCPACGAQFNLEDHLMPEGGRKLRCSKCGHVWHAAPPEAAAKKPQPIPETLKPSAPASAEKPAAAPAPAAKPVAAEKPASPEKSGKGGSKLAAFVLLLVLFALISVFIGMRKSVVEAFPPAKGVYEGMGISGGPSWKDLEISGVSAVGVTEPAGISITVSGEIVNHGASPVKRPHLVGTLSGGGAPVAFSIEMQPGMIAPGDREAFSRTLHGLPEKITSVDITFSE